MLRRTRSHYRNEGTATVGELLEPLGGEAAALGSALLALPFLSPISLGPLTSGASALIILLGTRLLREKHGAPLPRRLLRLRVAKPVHDAMDRLLRRVARLIARFSRPRFPALVRGRAGRMLCGGGLIASAILLAVPIPLLPLTNTLPAIAIIGFGLGWAERDGLLTLVGAGTLLVSAAYFVALAGMISLFGSDAVQRALS